MKRPTPAFERSLPTGSHNSTTVQHKDRERAELADLLAAFKRAGGKVQVLANTPVRRELSRRQVNDAAAASRVGTPKTLANVTPPHDLRTQLPTEADHA